MDNNISIIAKVIAAKYKSTKMSKRDIALKTNLSLNTVNNALQGKNLTLNTVFKIMDVFGMSLEDVIVEGKAMGHTWPKPSTATIAPTKTSSASTVVEEDEDEPSDSDVEVFEIA